jgi:hypothetical protein
MRCQKCGFISFDYLSECKKCGINLAGVRDGLGFFDLKPSIPFFLGPLLKTRESRALDLGGEEQIPGPAFTGESRAAEVAETPLDLDSLDDELTIELSDDELSDLLDDTGEHQTDVEYVLETADVAGEAVGEPVDEDYDTEIHIGDELEIELKDEDEPEPEAILQETPSRHEKGPKASAASAAHEEGGDEELVLELEPTDLETFLRELDTKAPDKL